jgi:uncharacterized YccA/Bax inhibitor family protein
MTTNPALNNDSFTEVAVERGRGAMTVQGAVNRTAFLLALVIGTGAIGWNAGPNAVGLALLAGIPAFIVAIITCFKKSWSPVLAPTYAVLKGLAIGAISAAFNRAYPGIVLQAVILTAATLCIMLGAYTTGLLRATEGFVRGVMIATGAIALFYLVSLIFSLCGSSLPIVHGNGTLSIVISVVVVGVAAMNLIIDFAVIEHGAAGGAPKYMEWYAAFGLLVTLVWLYLELLRLLAKISSRK